MTEAGMLSIEDLASMVDRGDVETVVVAFTDHYGRMAGKRLDADFFLSDAANRTTHACDYLLTVDMEMEPVEGYELSNWDLGYGDFHMVPDLDTLRVADWLDKTALVLCDVVLPNHEPAPISPRAILRRQISRLSDQGFEAYGASELEYYLYQDTYHEARAADYRDLTPSRSFRQDYHLTGGRDEEQYNSAVRRHLSRSGVPVESSKGEWGRGQHEMNVRYTDVLAMADRHVVLKMLMRDVAEREGLSVTFMAKPYGAEAGSSCHLHVSLWDRNGNAFAAESGRSDVFRHFLGGWLAHLPESMVMYAPTVNSYKRFQEESWAPTRMVWSHDNRTAGFRIVGEDAGLRIECRIPGADCNPYLAFAAAIAAGLDGLQGKIEPPDEFIGNAYEATDAERVPTSLREAADAFVASDFVAAAFGDDVQAHYGHFFRTEQLAFDRAVTDWERSRYFERI